MRTNLCILWCILLSFPAFLIAQETDSTRQAVTVLREAVALLKAGDYEASYHKFEEGLALKPDMEHFFYFSAGGAACRSGRMERATELLLEAIDRGMLDESFLEETTFYQPLMETRYWPTVTTHFERSRAAFLEQFVSLDDHPLHEFIPFQQDGKWGYLSAATGEILVEPAFLSTVFPGDALKVEVTPYQFVLIDPSMELEYQVVRRRPKNIPPPPPVGGRALKPGPLVDTKLPEYGFRINEEQKITHVGAAYARNRSLRQLSSFEDDQHVRYRTPFLLDGRWHIAALRDGFWGAIDEEGQESEAIPCEFRRLFFSPNFDPASPWLIFSDSTGTGGFINSEGEKRFEQCDVTTTRSFNVSYSADWDVYLLKTDGLSGVVDLRTMEWLVEPAPLKFKSVKCTFTGDVKSPPKSRTEEVVDLYFLVENPETGEEYYVGKDNRSYRLEE